MINGYIFKNIGEITIEIIEKIEIIDTSYLFSGCSSLTSIDSLKN